MGIDTAPRPVRVLIVDDSAMIRKVLALGLATDPMIEVVGTASGADQAREMIEALKPDVMTLDIEMPRMDGVSFLRELMPRRPLPTVVISSATRQGAAVTLQALEAGAVDVIAKPSLGVGEGLGTIMADVCRRVRAAAHARHAAMAATAIRVPAALPRAATSAHVLLVGASTGGVQALARLLQSLPDGAPAGLPGLVIVQHMPEGFTAAFAQRLDAMSPIRVREARDGDTVQPGQALVAPGGSRHLSLTGRAPDWRVSLEAGPPVCFSTPSVDVLFLSAARVAGPRCSAALLTGMGRDGAEGMLALRRAGARTIAQDEASSVVWGMPGAAVALGAAEAVLPLDAIGPALIAGAFRTGANAAVKRKTYQGNPT
jgi:two-component system chemotaxis response regulator CheB